MTPNVVLFVVVMLAFALHIGSRTLTLPPGNDPENEYILGSGVLVTFLWSAGWPLTLSVRRLRLDESDRRGANLRLVYTVGGLFCLFHIAVAFHVGHEWSHQKAFEHTGRSSGFGPGIFVNYLFVVVWLADVVWAWVAFDHYLNRPRWVCWAVFGFMGFIVVNAAVVFGTGNRRWVSVLLLVVSAVWVLKGFLRARPPRRGGR
jgi:hypothetical protein